MVIRQGGVSKERDDEGKRKKEQPKGAVAVECAQALDMRAHASFTDMGCFS